MNDLYLYGSNERIFLNINLGCSSNCSYCYLSDLSINVIKKDDMNLSSLQIIVSFDFININNVNKIENLLYISDEIEKVIKKYDISKKLFMEKNKPNKIGEICYMRD